MAADAEDHVPFTLVSDVEAFLDHVVQKLIADPEFKLEGVDSSGFFCVGQKEGQLFLSLLFQGKFHVAGKAVLSHVVGLALVAVFIILQLAHDREQDWSMPAPDFRVSLPDVFIADVLTNDALQLCPAA